MPLMRIGTNNWEEERVAMKATLEKLTEDNKEKKTHIKLQEEKIARLTTKLEKQLAQSFTKTSKIKEEKVSIQSEASNEEVCSKKSEKLKNDGSQAQ